MVLAQDEEHETRAPFWYYKKLGILTSNLLEGIGYYDKYEEMEADGDDNGCVSLDELSDYLDSKRIVGSIRWNPDVFGSDLGLRLFHFARVSSIGEGVLGTKEIEKEKIVGTESIFVAHLKNDSGSDQFKHYVWKTSDPSIATIQSNEGTGLVSFHSEGKVTITCYLEDENGNMFLASGKAITLEVKKPSIIISPTSLKLYEKGNKSLKAEVTGTTQTPKWKSSDKSVATVDSKGKVTAKKAGTCIISAYLGDAEAGCNVTVKKPTIKLNKTSLSLDVKKTACLKATVDGSSKKVTWKSSNTKIATVDKKGKVTAKKAGKSTITATANGVSAKCKVKVQSEKDKAIEAYKKFLSQNSIIWSGSSYPASAFYFGLIYIDDDSIPELYLENGEAAHFDGYVSIFAWKDGKIKRIEEGMADTIQYYKKKGVYYVSYVNQGMHEYYYKYSKGTSKMFLGHGENLGGDGHESYFSHISKQYKEITKKQFKKKLKKVVGSTAKSKPKAHKNTKANRKKYLK